MVKKWLFLLAFLISQISFSVAQTPTVHASSISISNLYCNVLDASWTPGDGSNRIVIAREQAAVNATPVDGYTYLAKEDFGKGSKLGADCFVVFKGTANSFTLKNLKENTTYFLAVFEFNTTSTGVPYYLTTSGFATFNQKTESITPEFSLNHSSQCINGNKIVCTNSSSNSLGNNMAFIWDFGDSDSSFGTNASHHYAKGGIFKIGLTAISTGCTSTKTTNDTVIAPSTAYFELDKTISGNDSIQCLFNHEFKLINKSKFPPISYGTWDRTDNIWSTSQGHKGLMYNFDFRPTQSGVVTVKLIQQRQVSKGGIFCIDSFIKNLSVLPPPNPKFSFKISNDTVKFSATDSKLSDYSWETLDGKKGSGTNFTYVYPTSSNDTVTLSLLVTDSKGCQNIDTLTVIRNHSSIAHLKKQEILVYPSPVKDILFVEINQNENNLLTKCSLHSADGVVIFHQKSLDRINQLDVSSYPSGLYFLAIFSENESSVRRILIE